MTDPAAAPSPFADRRARFRDLHREGTFIIPNPFDAGSARLLTAMGFEALASTSSGFAGTLGRLDGKTDRDELVSHVVDLTFASHLPLNVDAERCFGDTTEQVSHTVELLAQAGAAGVSIEDWDPETGTIDPISAATARVAAAAKTASSHDVMLTARCENLLRGVDDLEDTVRRLCAYRDAGADVVYAPGLVDLAIIERVVREVAIPVNVLLWPGGPTIPQLANVGVRRVSVGGLLFKVAYGAVADAAQSLIDNGQLPVGGPMLDRSLSNRTLR
jgi:2-methylisocitrate lyase-like PEP mutase family enzyme